MDKHIAFSSIFTKGDNYAWLLPKRHSYFQKGVHSKWKESVLKEQILFF